MWKESEDTMLLSYTLLEAPSKGIIKLPWGNVGKSSMVEGSGVINSQVQAPVLSP